MPTADNQWRYKESYRCALNPGEAAIFLQLGTQHLLLCSLSEQHQTHPIWCVSFNFVDLEHKDVFASCSGLRVNLLFCMLCKQFMLDLRLSIVTMFAGLSI